MFTILTISRVEHWQREEGTVTHIPNLMCVLFLSFLLCLHRCVFIWFLMWFVCVLNNLLYLCVRARRGRRTCVKSSTTSYAGRSAPAVPQWNISAPIRKCSSSCSKGETRYRSLNLHTLTLLFMVTWIFKKSLTHSRSVLCIKLLIIFWIFV